MDHISDEIAVSLRSRRKDITKSILGESDIGSGKYEGIHAKQTAYAQTIFQRFITQTTSDVNMAVSFKLWP